MMSDYFEITSCAHRMAGIGSGAALVLGESAARNAIGDNSPLKPPITARPFAAAARMSNAHDCRHRTYYWP